MSSVFPSALYELYDLRYLKRHEEPYDGNIYAGNIIPSSTSTYSIGSESRRWQNIYAENISSHDIKPDTTNTRSIGSSALLWLKGWFNKLAVSAIESNCTARTITPETTGTYDLGSSTKKWANIHADQIYLGGIGRTTWPSAVAGSNGQVIQSGSVILNGQDGVTVIHNKGDTNYLVKVMPTTFNAMGMVGDIAVVKSSNTVVIYNSGIAGISANVEISAIA